MPSRRDLLGTNTTPDGPHWSAFRWSRISAFVGGVAAAVLYFWVNPFQYAPDWVAAALGSVPVGLLLYGVSSQSRQTCVKIAAGTAVGTGLGAAL